MSIMIDKKTTSIQSSRVSALMILSLMFPNYQIELFSDKILFKLEDSEEVYTINKDNFEEFKELLVAIFCLNRNKENQSPTYNPQGERAKAIAEKLRKGREKVAAAKGPQKISVLSRYVSILTVGEHKDMNKLLQLTVYQLFDEFERFELNEAYKAYFKAKLAGAQNLDEVDNWMKDLYP